MLWDALPTSSCGQGHRDAVELYTCHSDLSILVEINPAGGSPHISLRKFSCPVCLFSLLVEQFCSPNHFCNATSLAKVPVQLHEVHARRTCMKIFKPSLPSLPVDSNTLPILAKDPSARLAMNDPTIQLDFHASTPQSYVTFWNQPRKQRSPAMVLVSAIISRQENVM